MATAGRDACLIMAAAIPWHGPRHRQQEVAVRLAERYRVLYLEPPANPLRRRRGGAPPQQRASRPALDVSVEGPIVRACPRRGLLPGGSISGTVNAANRARVAARVNALREVRECPEKILWLDESAAYPYVGKFGESLVVYDCVDEDWAYARNPLTRRFLTRCEKEVTAAADVVFASSNTLYERKRREHPHAYWAPNAVDFEHFQRASLCARRGAGPVEGPQLCVMGHTMPQRTDLGMLREMARMRPQWRTVFIGRIQWPAGEPVPASFEFLGQRPYEELPELLAQMDVCLIPYRTDTSLDYIHPKKLHEYLAAGKPVVATALPELLPFDGIIKVARSAAELVEKAEECLEENADPVRSAQLIRRRQAVARENTWDRRVAQMIEIIERHLNRR